MQSMEKSTAAMERQMSVYFRAVKGLTKDASISESEFWELVRSGKAPDNAYVVSQPAHFSNLIEGLAADTVYRYREDRWYRACAHRRDLPDFMGEASRLSWHKFRGNPKAGIRL